MRRIRLTTVDGVVHLLNVDHITHMAKNSPDSTRIWFIDGGSLEFDLSLARVEKLIDDLGQ